MSALQLSPVTADHRTNRLLAALEPHLEVVTLSQGQVLVAEHLIGYAYFPQDAVMSLVNVIEDRADGRGVGLSGVRDDRPSQRAGDPEEAFGRHVVQMARDSLTDCVRD